MSGAHVASSSVLVIAFVDDDIEAAVSACASLPSDAVPVVLTSSASWASLRAVDVQWEYVIPEQEWEHLLHPIAWQEYLARRLAHVVATWRPGSIVNVGRPLATEHMRILWQGIAPARQPESRAGSAGERAVHDLEKRLERLARQIKALSSAQERQVLASAVASLVSRYVPPDDPVAVISRGDPLLVGRPGATHFPGDDAGAWTGSYPVDDDAAIGQLRSLIERGVRHVVVPEPARWWLDHYGGLAAWLRTNAVEIDEKDTGVLFQIRDESNARRAS